MGYQPWYVKVVLPVLELVEYTGASFRPEWCIADDRLVAADRKHYATALDFYRYGHTYLYHQTFFNMDVWRDSMIAFILLNSNPCDVLDYGCGIGAAGLYLEAWGYKASFADMETETMRYLRWRLAKRKKDNPVYIVGVDEIPRHSLVVALDVLEHIEPEYQVKFLEQCANIGERVIFNAVNDSDDYGEGDVHYRVDIAALNQWLEEKFDNVKTLDVHRGQFFVFDSKGASNG